MWKDGICTAPCLAFTSSWSEGWHLLTASLETSGAKWLKKYSTCKNIKNDKHKRPGLYKRFTLCANLYPFVFCSAWLFRLFTGYQIWGAKSSLQSNLRRMWLQSLSLAFQTYIWFLQISPDLIHFDSFICLIKAPADAFQALLPAVACTAPHHGSRIQRSTPERRVICLSSLGCPLHIPKLRPTHKSWTSKDAMQKECQKNARLQTAEGKGIGQLTLWITFLLIHDFSLIFYIFLTCSAGILRSDSQNSQKGKDVPTPAALSAAIHLHVHRTWHAMAVRKMLNDWQLWPS